MAKRYRVRGDQINWGSSKEDDHLIQQIGARAVRLGIVKDPLGVSMSITACHLNGCPLRLADLLAADDFNFTHDVCGIDRHVSRDTGRLLRHFVPRFTRREFAAASAA